MIAAILTLVSLVALIAITLSVASARLQPNRDDALEQINALLPQTQCGQCGFPGCRPYAEAMIAGNAEINRCAPGGEATILAIANHLDRPLLPADESYGTPKPAQVAVIAENVCIGCAACLQACPVDAILGAPHFMHTVITEECTGCELCIDPCPVDCIVLRPK